MIVDASLVGIYPVDYLQSEPKGMLIDDVSLCDIKYGEEFLICKFGYRSCIRF